jgi:hypothetical protein
MKKIRCKYGISCCYNFRFPNDAHCQECPWNSALRIKKDKPNWVQNSLKETKPTVEDSK